MPTIGQTRSEPFSLPEYECAQFRFFHAAVRKLMKAKDSLYASIPEAPPWESIPTTQNTMPTGEVVENKPLMIESRIVIKWDDIPVVSGYKSNEICRFAVELFPFSSSFSPKAHKSWDFSKIDTLRICRKV
jgi:hypothetical protein